MTNHPGRKPGSDDGWPIRMTPEQLRDIRSRCGLTQTQAAELCGSAALRTYQQWEAGDRAMPMSASGLLCCAVILLGMPPEPLAPWLPKPIAAKLIPQTE